MDTGTQEATAGDMKKRLNPGEYTSYYIHEAWCPNCGEKNCRYIKKGRKVDGLGCECDNCGCYVSFRPRFGR